METITVLVGNVVALSNGQQQDHTREVVFTGEKLGEHAEYGYSDRTGRLTDTRGVTQTLYRAADGRLIVHIEDWSRWQGEPTSYQLREVAETDLQPGGEFELLGAECGFGRPLTLDEGLSR